MPPQNTSKFVTIAPRVAKPQSASPLPAAVGQAAHKEYAYVQGNCSLIPTPSSTGEDQSSQWTRKSVRLEWYIGQYLGTRVSTAEDSVPNQVILKFKNGQIASFDEFRVHFLSTGRHYDETDIPPSENNQNFEAHRDRFGNWPFVGEKAVLHEHYRHNVLELGGPLPASLIASHKPHALLCCVLGHLPGDTKNWVYCVGQYIYHVPLPKPRQIGVELQFVDGVMVFDENEVFRCAPQLGTTTFPLQTEKPLAYDDTVWSHMQCHMDVSSPTKNYKFRMDKDVYLQKLQASGEKDKHLHFYEPWRIHVCQYNAYYMGNKYNEYELFQMEQQSTHWGPPRGGQAFWSS